MNRRLNLSIVFLFLMGTQSVFASPKPIPTLRIIEMPAKYAAELESQNPGLIKLLDVPARGPVARSSDKAVLLVKSNSIESISRWLHETRGRCGGFMDITDESKKVKIWRGSTEKPQKQLPILGMHEDGVSTAVDDVKAENIESFDKLYSNTFKTRNAKTEEGKKAPVWLMAGWQKMAEEAGRSDIKVSLMPPPSGYEQNSVRIEIPGSDPDAPVIVIGAHLDSINQSGSGAAAPGADDDGSGIATITEVYRVLLKNDLHPKAGVHLFGYAAEELGLLGSRVVAEQYQLHKVNVRAVMQLDMTAYPGETHAVTFMTDFVSKELTQWTEQVFGKYVGGDIKHDRCGYACSDHASWNRYGYPAVMPFEAPMNDMNNRIHSAKDIWDNRLDAEFAAKYAKLGVAFVLELAL
jgi:leucyl aminopeptidase